MKVQIDFQEFPSLNSLDPSELEIILKAILTLISYFFNKK